MGMMRTLLVTVFFLFIPAITYSSIIDQQQVEADGTLGVQGAGRIAQTFTAGISGQLELLEFGILILDFDQYDPVYIQIRETKNGVPKDEILAEKLFQLTDQEIPGASQYHFWAFGDFRDESIELTVDQQYALVVYTTSYTRPTWFSGNYDHPYDGGQVWGFYSSTNQWKPYIDPFTHEGVDMCFRTTIVPEPTTAVLMISGLAFLIRKRK
ncbi:MAG: PEP-CTERM sorting domain-containing protein [Planctomycetota bacterium]|jgi:hypothetical protein